MARGARRRAEGARDALGLGVARIEFVARELGRERALDVARRAGREHRDARARNDVDDEAVGFEVAHDALDVHLRRRDVPHLVS